MNSVLLLSIIGSVILVLLVVMLLFMRSYRQSLIRGAVTNNQRTISQVCNIVDDYLDSIDTDMELICGALKEPEESRKEFFDVFFNIRPDIVAVTTYNAQGDLVGCYSLLGEVRMPLEENLSFRKEMMDTYTGGYVSAPHVVTLFRGVYPWVITMIAPADLNENECWVALDISFSRISDYINGVGIGQRGYCFLADSDGNIVYHPQQQLIYSSLKSENTEFISTVTDGSQADGNVIYSVETLQNQRWRVVGVSFVQEIINESLHDLSGILLLTAAVILIAMILISTILSDVLSRPIRQLAEAMKQFEQNADEFTYTPVGGVQEVSALSDSFGHMVVRLQQLMNTVRDEQINLRKTELKALQAQINPHFLYNTLDAISWMCEQGKNDEAILMVNALAQLFRISISKGQELIPIRSELQHAESYLQIQSHRYKNQFVYSFDADEDCLDYLCSKITLQPILENALYHGINGLVDEGEITVTVRSQGENILITVADNGTGMNAEQIAAVMSKDRSDRSGIGIKNVDDRLKIYFGASYGITIDSVEDEGTQVHILLPKVREEGQHTE